MDTKRKKQERKRQIWGSLRHTPQWVHTRAAFVTHAPSLCLSVPPLTTLEALKLSKEGKSIENSLWREDPRWRLKGGSGQRELYKSKILLRHCSHTWQKKNTQKNQNFDNLNSQPVQSFSVPHYTEKTGGLLHCQMLTPNLLGKCKPTDEQISIK
jgi:hypothetical protein